MQGVLGRLWGFLGQRKKYWLLPLIVVLVIFGALLILSQQSGTGPFRYQF